MRVDVDDGKLRARDGMLRRDELRLRLVLADRGRPELGVAALGGARPNLTRCLRGDGGGRDEREQEFLHRKKIAASRKPNSVPTSARRVFRRGELRRMTIIPLAPPLLAESSDRPGDSDGPSDPACAGRLPIWSCSVRGFACHPCCHGRGALLPHLFTLTRMATLKRAAIRAVCFLCHCPSGCPDRALPGALPCGVRTFLPAFTLARSDAAAVWLTATDRF